MWFLIGPEKPELIRARPLFQIDKLKPHAQAPFSASLLSGKLKESPKWSSRVRQPTRVARFPGVMSGSLGSGGGLDVLTPLQQFFDQLALQVTAISCAKLRGTTAVKRAISLCDIDCLGQTRDQLILFQFRKRMDENAP